MKPARYLLAITLATAFTAGAAETLSDADARYVKRIDPRFAVFAGSRSNLESLAAGLRSGSQINLTGSGESTIVLPPTRPMGYGNVTRSLDLASRQLAAVGITEPTPREIGAALNGGAVSTSTGEVTLQGVLQLRSEGMGWGQVAHAIGVHPGMGAAKAQPQLVPAPAASSSGITTAAGGSVVRPGSGNGHAQKPAQAAVRNSALGSNSQGNGHAYGKSSGKL